jgi:hypothetical protein
MVHDTSHTTGEERGNGNGLVGRKDAVVATRGGRVGGGRKKT